MDTIIPFVYKNISAPFGDGHQFNLGDIYFSPLVLSRHFQQFDVAGAYGFYAPSGEFNADTTVDYLTSPGSGYWSHMFTLGGVWYPDEKKTWAVSLLNRYEINTEQNQTDITPGNMLSMDWGLEQDRRAGRGRGSDRLLSAAHHQGQRPARFHDVFRRRRASARKSALSGPRSAHSPRCATSMK